VLVKISQESLAEMHDAFAGELFHEPIRKLGFIDYNGDLKVLSSLLNVVLYDKPELQREQN
jgi:CRP/FNR family cyclic AMP-dependent transcriptional regulator